MSDYREQANKAKAKREGIIDQRAIGTRSKRGRPFVVEYRMSPLSPTASLFKGGGKWRKWGAYRTEVEAQQTLDSMQRKYSFYEFRHQPKAVEQHHDNDTKRAD